MLFFELASCNGAPLDELSGKRTSGLPLERNSDTRTLDTWTSPCSSSPPSGPAKACARVDEFPLVTKVAKEFHQRPKWLARGLYAARMPPRLIVSNSRVAIAVIGQQQLREMETGRDYSGETISLGRFLDRDLIHSFERKCERGRRAGRAMMCHQLVVLT